MADTDFVIALEPLFVGTARAHNRGDRVPKANVSSNGWQDGTAGPGTKAANAAIGAVEDEPLSVAGQSPAPK